MGDTRFQGVSLNQTKDFARQILEGLVFLGSQNLNIIHCDLKPRNIGLQNQTTNKIKIIDFGSSCYVGKPIDKCIQTLSYRSPEVLLGLKYGPEIDIWSLGCILVEIHIGKSLFNGRDEYDQMKEITNLRGMPPIDMIEKSTKSEQFFDLVTPNISVSTKLKSYKAVSSMVLFRSSLTANKKSSDADINNTTHVQQKPYYVMKNCKGYKAATENDAKPCSIASVIGMNKNVFDGENIKELRDTPKCYQLFLDLIDRMLDYCPNTRIKPEEALQHPFLNELNIFD